MNKRPKLQFPCMARRVKTPASEDVYEDPLIVLFTNKTAGMVIVGNDIYRVGEYFSNDWIPVNDDTVWEILPKNESVVLNLDQP